MAKFELTKTIEAVKLNKRTMRALGPEKTTIPYGALLTDMTEDRDKRKFFYNGEPFECPEDILVPALRQLE